MNISMNSRRAAAITLGTAATVAVIASAAVATTPGSTTDVAYIAVNHRVLNNTYVAAHGATSPVVIGGSTTVPTDATAVRLSVTVKGSAAGSLLIYPAGNLDGASGDTVSWTVAKSGAGIVSENVGTANEVTFVNTTGRPINITATLIGYSAQVSAGDISGQGGSAGQVLTNDGGGGASWQTPAPATVYDDGPASSSIPTTQQSGYPAYVPLPAGHYLVQATATVERYTNDATAQCQLVNGETFAVVNTAWASVTGSAPDASISLQAVITTTGDYGGVGFRCTATAPGNLRNFTLTALQAGSP